MLKQLNFDLTVATSLNFINFFLKNAFPGWTHNDYMDQRNGPELSKV